MSTSNTDLYTRQGKKPTGAAEAPASAEQPIKVDGFGQVIQLLQVADREFRDSLLRRLTARDPELARQLKAYLAKL